jgi:hypothetical protein
MTDETAKTARLLNVMEAIIIELQRQGVPEVFAKIDFDLKAMAEVLIKAADCDVVP